MSEQEVKAMCLEIFQEQLKTSKKYPELAEGLQSVLELASLYYLPINKHLN